MAKRATVRKAQHHYSQDDKIAAITAARTIGRDHPLSTDAIAAARKVVGTDLSPNTLARWLAEYGHLVDSAHPELLGRPVEEVIAETRDTILTDLATVRSSYITHLKKQDIIDKSSARDAAVVMGIANDHIIKMTDAAPSTMTILKRIAAMCQRTGYDIDAVLEDLEQAINASLPSIPVKAIEAPKE